MGADDSEVRLIPADEFRAEASARVSLARIARSNTKRLLEEIQGGRDWSSLGLSQDECSVAGVLSLAVESLQHAPRIFSKQVRDLLLVFVGCDDASVREAVIHGVLPHANDGVLLVLGYMATQDLSPRVRYTAHTALQAVAEADGENYEPAI